MPNFRVNVKVEQKGAIFKASNTKAAAARMVIGINDDIAQEGVTRILTLLGRALQNPTGFYESRIVVDRRQTYRGITDSGVVYGGWLEGITTRNSTTRFKGYHVFRTVQQQLAQEKEQLAAPAVQRCIEELS
jgi:hypothetical protein